MSKMNKDGKQMYDKWEEIYMKEVERRQAIDPSCETGWCIIEGDDFVKTLDDVVGIMIFGYDENALGIIDEWIADYGVSETAYGFTLYEIKEELKKYYRVEIETIEDANQYITYIYGLVSDLARQIYLECNAEPEPIEDCLDWITDWWIEVYGDDNRKPTKTEVLCGMCTYLSR